jgi:hypothetical protein
MLKWAGRGWAVVGLVLVALVVLEGMYRVARRLRNPATAAPVMNERALRHPYAGAPWFRGWYEQPVIRAGIVYDPYRAFHKAPSATPPVTVDSAGRRLTVQPPRARPATRRLFLLGGSTMWGYTARDSFTIPSLVASELKARGLDDVEVVNLAQPGYNATQEVITLFLALRDGDVPAAAVFLTTHKDIYAAFQSDRAGGITSEAAYAATLENRQPTLSDELEAVARRSALVSRLVPPAKAAAAPSYSEPRPQLCQDVARQYRELARLTASMGREYGFPFFFVRQSMLASSRKPLSAWERTMPRPRFEAQYRQCMAVIDSTMRSVPDGRYLSLAPMFDADTSSVFLDEYGYLTERAGGDVARRIVELVEPSLRRAARAVSR